MSKKIAISKDGIGVIGETDPNNLIYSSMFDTFKYNFQGNDTYTIPSSGSPHTGEHVIMTHNLGYVPFFVVFANDEPSFADRWYALPFSFADAFATDHRFVYATTTQIIFRYENTGFGIDIDIDFYFKIFTNDLGV